MKIKLLAATVLIFALGTGTAEAQRTKVQRQRIHQGVKNGDLTRAENRRLGMSQRNYHRHVRKAKADGVITHRERKELRMHKKHNSHKIFRKKHNRRHRF